MSPERFNYLSTFQLQQYYKIQNRYYKTVHFIKMLLLSIIVLDVRLFWLLSTYCKNKITLVIYF